MWITCDVCPGEQRFSRYDQWIVHLLSQGHAEEMKNKLGDVKGRSEILREGSFLIIFTRNEQGTTPNKLQLLQFFLDKGFLAQFYYEDVSRFCVVTVDAAYTGMQPVTEGQYNVEEKHVVSCLKAKDLPKVYWDCVMKREFPLLADPHSPFSANNGGDGGAAGGINGIPTFAELLNELDYTKKLLASMMAPVPLQPQARAMFMSQFPNNGNNTNEHMMASVNFPLIYIPPQHMQQFQGVCASVPPPPGFGPQFVPFQQPPPLPIPVHYSPVPMSGDFNIWDNHLSFSYQSPSAPPAEEVDFPNGEKSLEELGLDHVQEILVNSASAAATAPAPVESQPQMKLLLRPHNDNNMKVDTVDSPRNRVSSAHSGAEPKSRFPSLFKFLPLRPNAIKASRNAELFAKLSLSEQIDEFMLQVCLTPQDVHRRKQVLADINLLLQRHYPTSQVHPFGSFFTGLADATSDMDLVLLQYGGAPNILQSCAQFLRSEPARFSDVLAINTAKIPIVRFTHAHGLNAVHCDLSFGNNLAMINSQLILLYIELHPVVKPFLLLGRYWAKFHHLDGSGLIKNYCLVLMLLTFLANKKIIPSVAELRDIEMMEMVPQKSSVHHDGWNWNTTFSCNLQRIKSVFNSSLPITQFNPCKGHIVLQLFQEFCQFFAHLQLSTVVICSLTGEILPRQIFRQKQDTHNQLLPNTLAEFQTWVYKIEGHKKKFKTSNAKPLCVQDPFLLSFNVAGRTEDKIVMQFQSACFQTAQKLAQGVPSILELFVPIPEELRHLMFLTNFKKHCKTAQLRDEIVGFLGGHRPHRVGGGGDGHQLILPIHLLPREEIKKYFELHGENKKKGARFYTLKPTTRYMNVFSQLINYEHHQVMDVTPVEIKRKALLFWIQITNDFLNHFWGKCFELLMTREQCVRIDVEPDDDGEEDNENDEDSSQENKENEGEDEGHDVDPLEMKSDEFQSDHVYRAYPDLSHLWRSSTLVLKLAEIPEEQEQIMYMRLNCKGFAPTWDKKERDDVLKKIQGENNGNVSKSKKKSHSRPRPLPPPMNETYNSDPMDLQKKVTRIICAEYLKENENLELLLSFNVLLKMDCRWRNENPSVTLIVEKDESQKLPKLKFEDVFLSIMQQMDRTFSSYSLYRALSWLRVNKTERADQPAKKTFALNDEEFPSL